MRPAILASSLLATAVAAAPQPHPIVARGDGIIRTPVNAIAGPAPRLRIRQNEVEVLNQRNGARYAVEIEIGTPAQTVTLIVDTGSPNTWVNPVCETANIPADCELFPPFNPRKSTSFQTTNAGANLTYGIGFASVCFLAASVEERGRLTRWTGSICL